eukprot:2631711-Amphidinium_carterae.1
MIQVTTRVYGRVVHYSNMYFDMVAELARAIVNRASQLWKAIVLLHQWVYHWAMWTSGVLVGTVCAYLDGATGNNSDNDSESDDVVATVPAVLCGGPATLHIYRDDNIVGMLGKMSVKLPMPTHFDGRNPQFSNSETGQERSRHT